MKRTNKRTDMGSYFPFKSIFFILAVLALCWGCTSGYSSVGVSYRNYWEPYRGYGPQIHYNYRYQSHRHKQYRHAVGRPHHHNVKGQRRPRPPHRSGGHGRR